MQLPLLRHGWLHGHEHGLWNRALDLGVARRNPVAALAENASGLYTLSHQLLGQSGRWPPALTLCPMPSRPAATEDDLSPDGAVSAPALVAQDLHAILTDGQRRADLFLQRLVKFLCALIWTPDRIKFPWHWYADNFAGQMICYFHLLHPCSQRTLLAASLQTLLENEDWLHMPSSDRSVLLPVEYGIP